MIAKKRSKKRPTRYKSKDYSKYSDLDAKTIGAEIYRLEHELGTEVKAKDLLEASRHPSSALYNYFDWSDKKAAEKWRRQQAQKMIQSVYVIIETTDGPKESRAWISVTSHERKGKTFVGVSKALSDKDYRKQTIDEAMRQVQIWRNKYRLYKELANIFKAIDNWKE